VFPYGKENRRLLLQTYEGRQVVLHASQEEDRFVLLQSDRCGIRIGAVILSEAKDLSEARDPSPGSG
jgi:hypothetical protein